MTSNKLYFKQLLAGRDFAKDDENAARMENFVYLIGDKDTKQCAVIDAAWDIKDIIDIAQKDGMKITDALATHYHQDHVGGTIFGVNIEGLKELMAKNPCKVHSHKLEKPGIIQVTGLSNSDVIGHDSGDKIKIGQIEIEIMHTPGHTPGSCCFKIKDSLLSGDTLFLRSCGRVDLPGGSVEEMYDTLTKRFDKLDANTIVFPGHNYGGDNESLAKIKKENPVFKYENLNEFRKRFY